MLNYLPLPLVCLRDIFLKTVLYLYLFNILLSILSYFSFFCVKIFLFCIRTTYQITQLTTSLEILTENFVSGAQLQTSKLPSLSSHYTFSCQNIILPENKVELKFTNNKKQLHKYVIQNKYISYTTAIHEEIHLTCNTNTTAMHTKYNTITLELEAGFQIFLPGCHNTNCPKSLKIVQSKLRHFLEPIQEGFNLTVLLASY